MIKYVLFLLYSLAASATPVVPNADESPGAPPNSPRSISDEDSLIPNPMIENPVEGTEAAMRPINNVDDLVWFELLKIRESHKEATNLNGFLVRTDRIHYRNLNKFSRDARDRVLQSLTTVFVALSDAEYINTRDTNSVFTFFEEEYPKYFNVIDRIIEAHTEKLDAYEEELEDFLDRHPNLSHGAKLTAESARESIRHIRARLNIHKRQMKLAIINNFDEVFEGITLIVSHFRSEIIPEDIRQRLGQIVLDAKNLPHLSSQPDDAEAGPSR